nr:PAS domain-containing protein [Archaeoglobus neptunius]
MEDELRTFLKAVNTVVRRYTAIFENAPVSILVVRADGTVEDANPAAVAKIGTNPIGKSVFELFDESVAQERMGRITRAIEGGESIAVRESRDHIHFHTVYCPLREGDEVKCLVVAVDISSEVWTQRLCETIKDVGRVILRAPSVGEIVKGVGETLLAVDDFRCVEVCIRGVRHSAGEPDNSGDVVRLPLVVGGREIGYIEIHAARVLSEKERKLLDALAQDVSFAVRLVEIQGQLNKNLEKIVRLIDGIRNPLTAIVLTGELKLSPEWDAVVKEQVGKIVGVLELLDDAWEETEKIR